jgi:hypothetical protein
MSNNNGIVYWLHDETCTTPEVRGNLDNPTGS